eukprot:tig00001049_g6663.t1
MPHVVRRWVARKLSAVAVYKTPFIVSFLLFGLLFVDAIREMVHVSQRKEAHVDNGHGHAHTSDLNARLFRAQRNAYLLGFTLLGQLLLLRLTQILRELCLAEDNSAVLKSQAEGTRKAYESILDEKNALEQKFKTLFTEDGSVDDQKLNKILAAEVKNTALEKKLEAAEQQLAQTKQDNERLKNKLDDFETLMGTGKSTKGE